MRNHNSFAKIVALRSCSGIVCLSLTLLLALTVLTRTTVAFNHLCSAWGTRPTTRTRDVMRTRDSRLFYSNNSTITTSPPLIDTGARDQAVLTVSEQPTTIPETIASTAPCTTLTTSPVTTTTTTTPAAVPSVHSLIRTDVKSLQDFERMLHAEQQPGRRERLTVVRFYAPYCPACKAAKPSFERLVRKHYQQRHEHLSNSNNKPACSSVLDVNWVNVALTRDNDDLRDALNLEVIPFGQIYHPSSFGATPLEGLNLGQRHMGMFEQTFQTYVQGECNLPVQALDNEAEEGLFDDDDEELWDPSQDFLSDEFYEL